LGGWNEIPDNADSSHASDGAGLCPAWAQQKPLTRDQVQGLVRDGLGDESGAKLIEQRGIDFAPAEGFLQSLKARRRERGISYGAARGQAARASERQEDEARDRSSCGAGVAG